MHKPPYRGTVSGGFRSWRYNYGTTNTAYDMITLVEAGSITSVRTPGFKTKRRDELPFNPFSYSYNNTTYKPGSNSSSDGRFVEIGYVRAMVTIHNQLPLLVANESDADVRARNSLLKQFSNMSVNLAQTYAERKQTVNMLTKTVNRLASAAIAIRRGKLVHAQNLFRGNRPSNGSFLGKNDFGYKHRKQEAWENRGGDRVWKDIKPSPDNLANHWLEFSYGWRPLLNDIYGCAELLANTYYRKRPTVYRSTGRDQKQRFGYMVCSTQLSSPSGFAKEVANSTAQAEVKYVVEYIEDSQFLAMMSAVGLHQPWLLAWELLPYSFVVDWVLPIGTYVKNMSATRGMLFVRGTKSVKLSGTHSTTWQNVNITAANVQVPSGLGRDITLESKVRTVLTGFPSPPIPTLRMPSELNQLLSGLALLTQAFKR